MASIKQLTDRKFKITVSNGYRPNGKKICKAKTITVPDSVKPRGIPQYVAHEAEELERLVKSGFAEDRDTTFEAYASRWLERQVKYASSTLASYRRMLERLNHITDEQGRAVPFWTVIPCKKRYNRLLWGDRQSSSCLPLPREPQSANLRLRQQN